MEPELKRYIGDNAVFFPKGGPYEHINNCRNSCRRYFDAVACEDFTSPIKIIFKLLLNTILGFFALIAINYFGAFIGLTIGVNFINALVIGCLGVPGVGLLLLLRWLMIT